MSHGRTGERHVVALRVQGRTAHVCRQVDRPPVGCGGAEVEALEKTVLVPRDLDAVKPGAAWSDVQSGSCLAPDLGELELRDRTRLPCQEVGVEGLQPRRNGRAAAVFGRLRGVADHEDGLWSVAQVHRRLPGAYAHSGREHHCGERDGYPPYGRPAPRTLARAGKSYVKGRHEAFHVHSASVGSVETPYVYIILGRVRGRILHAHRLASKTSFRVRRARLRWLFTAPSDIPMICEISWIDMSAW